MSLPPAYDGIGLRMPTTEDRQRLLELQRDPAELRYGVPAFVTQPEDLAGLDEFVEGMRKRIEEGEPSPFIVCATADPEVALGTTGWRTPYSREMGIAEIGYAVHPDARGRGVARRAVRGLLRWLMHDSDGPGLARVQLDHSVENAPSCGVALGAGMIREGTRTHYLPLRDLSAPGGVRRHDVCLHGITELDPLDRDLRP